MFDEADVASSRQEQAALSSPTADGAAATVAEAVIGSCPLRRERTAARRRFHFERRELFRNGFITGEHDLLLS